MRILINEKQTGTRTINGTDFPVCDRLDREQIGKKITWVITRSLCNGTPFCAEVYKTKKDAIAKF